MYVKCFMYKTKAKQYLSMANNMLRTYVLLVGDKKKYNNGKNLHITYFVSSTVPNALLRHTFEPSE